MNQKLGKPIDKASHNRVKKIVGDIIALDKNKYILSIYGMGAYAEGRGKFANDIDFTIIIKDGSYNNLKIIKKAIDQAEIKNNIKIDTNFIILREVNKDIINSRIFPHKGRHAFLVFELLFYNWLLYGKDLLQGAKFYRNETIPDSLKLLLTLGYRLRKMYFTQRDNRNEIIKQSVKFYTYACKFSLLNKGLWVYDDESTERVFKIHFKNYFDMDEAKRMFELRKFKLKSIKNNLSLFEISNNFIEKISVLLLDKYKRLKKARVAYVYFSEKNEKNILRDFKILSKKYKKNVDLLPIKMLDNKKDALIISDSLHFIKDIRLKNNKVVSILIQTKKLKGFEEGLKGVDYILSPSELELLFQND